MPERTAAFGGSPSGYGLGPASAGSAVGALLTALRCFDAVAAYGLIRERRWGVDLGIAAGAVGLLVCIGARVLLAGGFPWEALMQVPFLLRLGAVRSAWLAAATQAELDAALRRRELPARPGAHA